MKMVRARGATMGLRAVKEPLTLESTNSTTHSTKFWSPEGTPAAEFLVARLNKKRNRAPSSMEKPMVSTLMAQKPMSLASWAEWARAPGAFHLSVAALIAGGQ
jgi:hypothetical protein